MIGDEAKRRAQDARAGLDTTIAALRARLTPQSLLRDGAELARGRAIKLAATTLASSKGRPIVAAGAIAVAAAYLLRKPIARAINQRLAKEKDDE